MADFVLNWKGDELKLIMRENGAKIISEFGYEVEGEAKRVLRRGHGVKTGTLRRSIHAVIPGYDWGGDDVEPSPSTPERSTGKVMPNIDDITLQVGSGLKYAMAANQRHKPHGSFVGYHYMNIGLEKAKTKLNSIIAKHKVQR